MSRARQRARHEGGEGSRHQTDEQRRDDRQGHDDAEQEGHDAERDDAAAGADEAERGDDQQRGRPTTTIGLVRWLALMGWGRSAVRIGNRAAANAGSRPPISAAPSPATTAARIWSALGISGGAARSPGAMPAWKAAPSRTPAEDADRNTREGDHADLGGEDPEDLSRRCTGSAEQADLAAAFERCQRGAVGGDAGADDEAQDGDQEQHRLEVLERLRRSGARVVRGDARAELRVHLGGHRRDCGARAEAQRHERGPQPRTRTCWSSPRRR